MSSIVKIHCTEVAFIFPWTLTGAHVLMQFDPNEMSRKKLKPDTFPLQITFGARGKKSIDRVKKGEYSTENAKQIKLAQMAL